MKGIVMSVINEIRLDRADLNEIRKLSVSGTDADLLDAIRKFFADGFWKWYRKHENDAIVTVKLFWIFSKTVRVKDLKKVFVKLFGDPSF